ncbi:MAG: Gfo/Idh/MocA family oxidoreductase [Rikenellaceae bacterium]
MMKNLLRFTKTALVAASVALVFSFSSCCQTGTKSTEGESKLIKTEVPVRPEGQQDVLDLVTDPIPNVRVAFIGLGQRGPGAVYCMANIPGVEIVALCDVIEGNTKKCNEILAKAGRPKAEEFFGDTAVWRKVTALPNVDLVYVATDWSSHAMIGVQAMKDGKHVAIEVPSATSLEEIWDLVNTAEQTRKHCMQLENCVYDFYELTTLNMVQQGLLGEVIHGEGAYMHNLAPFWGLYWNNWRLDFNRKHRSDSYPTHGLGPVCQAMNMHRGDKMNVLVAMDTKPLQGPAVVKQLKGEDAPDYKAGDHTMTMISTEKGRTIHLQHDVVSPRPYSRMYQISGTKGFANKYPNAGYALSGEAVGADLSPDFEKLSAHEYLPEDVKKALMEKYKHPILKELETRAKEVGGHGGMDFIMDYRLIYCLQNGLPLDMDVYDLAEWCSVIPLSAISLENGFAPVEVPDFTRGGWNKIDGYKQAFKK